MAIKYLAAAITALGMGLMIANWLMDGGAHHAMFKCALGLIVGGSLLEITRRSLWKQPQL